MLLLGAWDVMGRCRYSRPGWDVWQVGLAGWAWPGDKGGRLACFGDHRPAAALFARWSAATRRRFLFPDGWGQRGTIAHTLESTAQRRPFWVGGVPGASTPARVLSPSGLPSPRRNRVGPVNKRASPPFSQIGGGPTEAECKTTTRRIKGHGRRWDSENAGSMMALAALDDSGLWHQRWEIPESLRNQGGRKIWPHTMANVSLRFAVVPLAWCSLGCAFRQGHLCCREPGPDC